MAHVHLSSARRRPVDNEVLSQSPIIDNQNEEWRMDWIVAEDIATNWTSREKALREIPEYVLEYAPLVHLFSGENYWPSDIAEHLVYTTPQLNYTSVQAKWDHPSLQDLDRLNRWDLGKHVYLASNDDVETRPAWLASRRNIPIPQPGRPVDPEEPGHDTPDNSPVFNKDDDRKKWYDAGGWADRVGSKSEHSEEPELGDLPDIDIEEIQRRYAGKPIQPVQPAEQTNDTNTAGGRSDAPAFLVVIDKGNDIVDAFWFFFYSYNLGNAVFNVRFGNHVGDWEHTMVRFYKGNPKALFLSAHTAGKAYSYEAIEKQGKRVCLSITLSSFEDTYTDTSSPLYIQQLAHMPCMPLLGSMNTFFPGDCFSTRRTEARCGTLFTTHTTTHTTTQPMFFEPPISPRCHQPSGSISTATGEINSTL